MIKVETLETKDSTKLYFESRGTDQDSLEELDRIYAALMGSLPKIGGYEGSNRFVIEVQNPES